MRKLLYLVLVSISVMASMLSCSDYETYADQKKKENSAISTYLIKNNVKVISEEAFEAKGFTTDTVNNEWVLFESNGVYMQILRKGCGKPIADGETTDVLCRFTELNILTDSVQLSNDNLYFSSIFEKMTVRNTSGSYTGSFVEDQSLMYNTYNSASVPAGWLSPLAYINVGRPVKEDDEIAKVKIIVPSAQGHSDASQRVYPCMYTLTYQKGV